MSISIDRLSIFLTCRLRSSAFRMPVEYSTISIVRSVSVRAASINRVTSSTVRMVGRRLGTFGYGMSSSRYRRFSVFTKKNRSAERWSLHRSRLEFAVAQQVGLILAEVGLIELVRRPVKMPREPLDGLDVVLNSGLRVVATLELVQHRLSEMGHRNLLVTQTLPDRSSVPHA